MVESAVRERPAAVERALRFIRNPGGDRFEDVALAVFGHQLERNAPYARFCSGRGVKSAALDDWRRIPPVPASAFKDAELVTAPAVHVFRTSGTSRGEAARGRHALPELDLYRAAWAEPFRRHLLPDRDAIRMFCLVPSPEQAPESSLAFMMGEAATQFGAPGSGFFLSRGELDVEALERAVAEAAEVREPVLVAGTAHALAVWMERRSGSGVSLPPGSRVMDTGGMKGRGPERPREETVAEIAAAFGIPPTHVVGEYGMTELCSQFYEPALVAAGREERRYVGPPWTRTQVLDPDTLAPLPAGRTGLLAHWDLANAWTVAAVVTEDLGVILEGGGFRLLGRAEGAELRGCSLATEELLRD